jgi:hypothetical protein
MLMIFPPFPPACGDPGFSRRLDQRRGPTWVSDTETRPEFPAEVNRLGHQREARRGDDRLRRGQIGQEAIGTELFEAQAPLGPGAIEAVNDESFSPEAGDLLEDGLERPRAVNQNLLALGGPGCQHGLTQDRREEERPVAGPSRESPSRSPGHPS